MLKTTAEHFKINKITADKAYLSNANLELVDSLGATAYIPFKSNCVPGEPGSLWDKAFHFYHLRREEFLQHYHQRSKVESVFSMIKAKLGDYVRSRVTAAMVNEAYCKFLCHNLFVLIRSQCELGIEADFWGKNYEEGNRILLPFSANA